MERQRLTARSGRRPIWRRGRWTFRISDYWNALVREHLRLRHLFFVFVQVGAAGAWLFWFFLKLPPPGFGVIVISILAAAMTIHGEMRVSHKVIWLLLIAAFSVVEFRAINEDRAKFASDEAKRRKEENENFKDMIQNMITLTNSTSETKTIVKQIQLSMEDRRKTKVLLDQAQLVAGKRTPKVDALALADDMFSYLVEQEQKNPSLIAHKGDPESQSYFARDMNKWRGEAIEGFHQKFGDRIKTTLASFPGRMGYVNEASHSCEQVNYWNFSIEPIRGCALSFRDLAEHGD